MNLLPLSEPGTSKRIGNRPALGLATRLIAGTLPRTAQAAYRGKPRPC